MDDLKRAVQAELGLDPAPQRRRAVAGTLRQLAGEQEKIATAADRETRKPPAQRIKRVPGGPRGRQPARFVRIDRRHKGAPSVQIGRGYYYELAQADVSRVPPPRIDIQKLAGRVHLIGIWHGDAGYAVNVGKGIPRFYAAGSRDQLASLEDGTYAADVRGATLVVGDAL